VTDAVLVPIGSDHYAVSAGAVREVVCAPHVTRLPTSAASVLGAFNLRGEVVPLFDLAALLGRGGSARASFAVVVSTPGGPAGLAVDGLPLVVALRPAVAPSELRGRHGVHAFDGGLAVLLDVAELLAGGVDMTAAATAEHIDAGSTVLA
jgi:chemotaxis signal transduction protein